MKCKRLRRQLKRLKNGDTLTMENGEEVTRIDEHTYVMFEGPALVEYMLDELISLLECT